MDPNHPSSPQKKRSLNSASYNHSYNSYPRQSSYSLSSINSQPGEFSNQQPQQPESFSDQPAPGSLFTAQQRLHAQALAAQSAQERAQQAQDQVDHPNKKRRGLTGAIVEGALSAAIATGAAAITAYSLWSSWGNRGQPAEEGQQQVEGSQPEASGNAASGNEKRSLEEAPPPYQYPVDVSIRRDQISSRRAGSRELAAESLKGDLGTELCQLPQ